MTEGKPHPLEGAAQRALEKAQAVGGSKLAKWNAKEKAWKVRSGSDPSKVYTVSRAEPSKKAENVQTNERQSRGTNIGWLFTLKCDCPATATGYAACWHKGAVRLWWSDHGALDGDQIARRNLGEAKEKVREGAYSPDGWDGTLYDADTAERVPPAAWDDWEHAYWNNVGIGSPNGRQQVAPEGSELATEERQQEHEESNVHWEEQALRYGSAEDLPF